ncbi:MAG TPA: fatty-acid--CoA ligase [Gammaproteobacteria bacterium]|jgi:long-chain acyl-CoA synthetase|nr:fatty-acid--CoA ligase [Gammaproteobacteria bacterium]
MRLHDILELNARRRGSSPALVSQDGRCQTFAELCDRSLRLASALAADGQPGDHVAILADNQPEYVEAYYGVPAAGQRLVFLNYRLAVPELVRIVNDARATRLLYAPAFTGVVERMRPELETVRSTLELGAPLERFIAPHPARAPFPALDDREIAWIIYTSGTTGMPKGAMLSHRNLFASIFNSQVSQPGEPPENPYFLMPFPLCHIAGFAVLGQHLVGNPVALMTAYSSAAWMRMVDELRITGTALAPTMINMLLNDPGIATHDLGSLRSLGYGASSIPAEVLRRAMARFGPIFTQGFGMTELAGNVIFMSKADHVRADREAPELLRAAGRVGALAAVRIVDAEDNDCPVGVAGEIVVRGDQVLAGYWNRPEANAEAFRGGWFHTGDVARMDDEGFVYIVDRKKDMIVSGGENVYPREVEEVLFQHPAVAEAAVFGLPDTHWGERVSAAIVLRPEARVEPAELDAFCRGRLAGYKRPRDWHVVSEIPKNVSGKVLKRELRERFGPAGEALK